LPNCFLPEARFARLCFCPRPDFPVFWKYISLHLTAKASK
jgi:hypothetical protein